MPAKFRTRGTGLKPEKLNAELLLCFGVTGGVLDGRNCFDGGNSAAFRAIIAESEQAGAYAY